MTPASPFAALLPSARRRRLAPGERLFRQGDATSALYVVEAGRVALLRHTSEGAAVTVHVAREGETAPRRRSSPSATAATPWPTPRRRWRCCRRRRCAARCGPIRSWPTRSCGRWRARSRPCARGSSCATCARLGSGSSSTSPSRPARRATWLDRPLKEVAAEIGLSHEALYRTLATLEAEGRIARSGRAIRLVGTG